MRSTRTAVIGAVSCSTSGVSYTVDITAPTISSASASGGTITVRTSEKVWSENGMSADAFRISCENIPDQVPTDNVSRTKSGASNSFTITYNQQICTNATLTYTSPGSITDQAGNDLASKTLTVSGGVSSPDPDPVFSAPTVALQSPSTSPGTVSTPTIRVTVDSDYIDGSVQLFRNSCSGAALSDSVSVSAANTDVTTTALTSGQSYTIYAKHINGNRNKCSTSGVTYQYNAQQTPNLVAPTVVLKTGGSLRPTFTVTVDSAQKNGSVRLYWSSGCGSGSISGSVRVNSTSGKADVTTNTLTSGQSYTVYAKHTDSSSRSACSAVGVSYIYTTGSQTPSAPSVVANGTKLKPGG